MSAPPRLFDRDLLRKRLDRAARAYASANFLKRRAAEDLVERLETILRDFPRAVDLGARDGSFAAALAASTAATRVGTLIEADLSGGMLAGRSALRIQADEERLPFAGASLNLVVSALSLHWANDLPGALIQIRRALKPDGLFLAAVLGGDTLTELRGSLVQAESELSGGATARVSPLMDGYDGVGLLQRAGFHEPVADLDHVIVRYDNPLRLMADLRAMGETNALADRAGPKLTRAVLSRTFEIYQERFAEPDGRLPATFDIVTLTGWSPA